MSKAVLTFEKVIERGSLRMKLVKIEGVLQRHELPEDYAMYAPAFFGSCGLSSHPDTITDIRIVRQRGYEATYSIGSLMTRDQVKFLIRDLKLAGLRLTAINREVEKRRATWAGEVKVGI